MFRWISDKVLGRMRNRIPVTASNNSPINLLEQSIAYSAYLSNQGDKGEKISFEEFLRRRNSTGT